VKWVEEVVIFSYAGDTKNFSGNERLISVKGICHWPQEIDMQKMIGQRLKIRIKQEDMYTSYPIKGECLVYVVNHQYCFQGDVFVSKEPGENFYQGEVTLLNIVKCKTHKNV